MPSQVLFANLLPHLLLQSFIWYVKFKLLLKVINIFDSNPSILSWGVLDHILYEAETVRQMNTKLLYN